MMLSLSLEHYVIGSRMIKGNSALISASLLPVLEGNAPMLISQIEVVDALFVDCALRKSLDVDSHFASRRGRCSGYRTKRTDGSMVVGTSSLWDG